MVSNVRRPEPKRLENNLIKVASERGLLEAYNGVFDKQGDISKRFGLLINRSVNNQVLPIYGSFWWQGKGKLISVVGGKFYATSDLSVPDTDISGSYFITQKPAIFADTGFWLYMCSEGSKLVKWDGSKPTVEYETDSVAPTNVDALETINTRIVASESGTNRMWYTNPADTTNPHADLVWDGYVDIDRSGEKIIAIKKMNSEIIIFKEKSMSSWYDDGLTPFKPIVGSEHRLGMLTATSSILVDDSLFFLDSDKDFSVLSNKRITKLSNKWMRREFAKLKYLDDAIAYRVFNYICLTFPTENKTFVFDYINKQWSNFSLLSNGQDVEFIGRSSAEIPTTGRTSNWVIGGKDGNRYFADFDEYTDNGNPFRFKIRTSHFDYGTNRRKKATRLVVKVSTESLVGLNSFAGVSVSLPDATRCTTYNYVFHLASGFKVGSVSNLPTGLSFNSATQTISGAVTDFVGTQNVGVRVFDSRGASKVFNTTINVTDLEFAGGIVS